MTSPRLYPKNVITNNSNTSIYIEITCENTAFDTIYIKVKIITIYKKQYIIWRISDAKSIRPVKISYVTIQAKGSQKSHKTRVRPLVFRRRKLTNTL